LDTTLNITQIKTDQIAPNDYNPNVVSADILAKLRAEIGQKGLCEPIIVRRRGDGYEIVDGEHRWRICRDLGWPEVPCIIQDYDDSEAKIKTLQLNYMRGSVIPVKLAALIHDLNKEIKLEDLAKRLPYEEPILTDHLELLKLPEDFGTAIEEQARKDEEEMPLVMSFVLTKRQAAVLEEAVKNAKIRLAEDTKNSKAVALEAVCAYYVENKGLKEGEEIF
jgi:ParB family chromosome partitioning protein